MERVPKWSCKYFPLGGNWRRQWGIGPPLCMLRNTLLFVTCKSLLRLYTVLISSFIINQHTVELSLQRAELENENSKLMADVQSQREAKEVFLVSQFFGYCSFHHFN